MLRCRFWVTKAGTLRPARPRVDSTPSTVNSVSSSMVSSPLDRSRYHSNGPSVGPSSGRSCLSLRGGRIRGARISGARISGEWRDRPVADSVRHALVVDQPCIDTVPSQPGLSLYAEDERRRCGGVGCGRGCAGGGRRTPWASGGAPGAGVDHVVGDGVAAAPAAYDHAGGGQATRSRLTSCWAGSAGRSLTAIGHGSPSPRMAKSPPRLTNAP